MKLDCKLNTMEYEDPNLLVALSHLGKDITFQFTFTKKELFNMFEEYVKQKLDINFECSEIRRDDNDLKYSNKSEMKIIQKELSQHFGKTILKTLQSQEDSYVIDESVVARKLFTFGNFLINYDGNNNIAKYRVSFNSYTDFIDTWFYKYITNNK